MRWLKLEPQQRMYTFHISADPKGLSVIYNLFATKLSTVFNYSLKVQIDFLELIHIFENQNDSIKSSSWVTLFFIQ